MPIPSEFWDSDLNGTYPQAFQDRYRGVGDAIYDDYPNRNPSTLQGIFDNAGAIASIWSAGEAFSAWWFHNLTGGTSRFIFGGDSWEDPYEIKYNAVDKCRALRSLGCRANTEDMCTLFNKRKTTQQGRAVGNTLYELSQCNADLRPEQEPFVWSPDGSLCIYDRYNFDGLDDFSAAGSGIFAILATFAAVPGCLAVQVNDQPYGYFRDAFYNWIGLSPDREKEPYLTLKGDLLCSGRARYMYTKACFTAEEVKECNPELYFDRLSKGLITYSSVPGIVPVGEKQPSPYLGLPFQPPVSVDIVPAPDYFGFTYGDYSAPFNSWSQGVTNATFSLGPYAKIKRFWLEDSTCRSPKEDFTTDLGKAENDSKYKGYYGKDEESPLYGRIIVIISGANAGELGFVLQDWYNFDDTPYNTSDGTSSGQQYPSKAEWWEGAVKIPMTVRFVHLSSQPFVEVEVAASAPIPTNSNFFPGPNLATYNDLSYDILLLMTSAAVVRSVFSGGWL